MFIFNCKLDINEEKSVDLDKNSNKLEKFKQNQIDSNADYIDKLPNEGIKKLYLFNDRIKFIY